LPGRLEMLGVHTSGKWSLKASSALLLRGDN
jgi:hypothetical protein